MRIFGPVVDGLRTAIDLYAARHRVITENLANVETPGYRARDLDFRAALARAFAPPAPEPAAGGERIAIAELGGDEPPQVIVDRSTPVKVDGNSVDVDTEMARLSENTLRITALSRMLARQYAVLKSAIDGSRPS
jgi:flagellar basal-body rod protein FlgB